MEEPLMKLWINMLVPGQFLRQRFKQRNYNFSIAASAIVFFFGVKEIK